MCVDVQCQSEGRDDPPFRKIVVYETPGGTQKRTTRGVMDEIGQPPNPRREYQAREKGMGIARETRISRIGSDSKGSARS